MLTYKSTLSYKGIHGLYSLLYKGFLVEDLNLTDTMFSGA